MKIFYRKIAFCLLLFLSIISKAQYPQFSWARHIGTTDEDVGYSVAVDSFGNVYTTGSYVGVVDFDPSPDTFNLVALNGPNIFVTKLSPEGNLIWAKSLGSDTTIINGGGGRALAMVLDVSGNIYLTGEFYAKVDFDPGLDTFILTSYMSSTDVFICKLDNSGDFLWAGSIGGSYSDHGTSISIDLENSVYFTGVCGGIVDFDPSENVFNLTNFGGDHFISKFDSNGNFKWAKQFGGNDFVTTSSVTDSSANLYIAGIFGGTADFYPGSGTYNLTASGNQDAYVCKLDSSGNFIWAKKMGGTGFDWAFSIALDGNNNVYTTGSYSGTSDFDPGAGMYNLTCSTARSAFVSKLDLAGNFVMAKSLGEVTECEGSSIKIDTEGNIYVVGYYQGDGDFDPSIDTFYVYSYSNLNLGKDFFVSKFDCFGDFLWVKTIGSQSTEMAYSLAVDNRGGVIALGTFQDNVDINPGQGVVNYTSVGQSDIFLLKLRQARVYGQVFYDANANCTRDQNEYGIPNILAIINPGNFVVQTDEHGYWSLDSLPVGTYNILVDVSGYWDATCADNYSFDVINSALVKFVPPIGLINFQPCSQPDVSITAPFLRRCFSNQVVYVQACNQNIATGALNAAYVDVELDSLLTPTSSSLSYTNIGNNKYRFNVGNINPSQCVYFTINTTVSCAANLQQTLCMEARLFPADSCVFDTIATPTLPVGPGTVTPCNLPWDHSSLSVDGYCANDTVYFTITNNGSATNGNMMCYAPVRVYADGVLSYTDSIMLGGGQIITYSYPGNGQTWILQADQHPLHPGNSHPNAHVEACGNLSNWIPNLVNDLPLDDADPIVDIYCGVVSGAYDPNDKTGFPTGLGIEHEILPNQQLQYLIRFQNTGTDTAFNIVVRDTLDTDLNIFSVVPGVASNNYSFRMYGPRVLEWTFNNIMLPDSNVNEATSHGFLTFRVDQQPNLTNGTKILNDADIYFDFNAPVITNETVHTINNQLHNFAVGIAPVSEKQKSTIKVFPNPTKGSVYVELKEVSPKTEVTVLNVLGQQISKQQFFNVNSCNLTIESEPGVYFIKVVSGGKTEYVKLLKL